MKNVRSISIFLIFSLISCKNLQNRENIIIESDTFLVNENSIPGTFLGQVHIKEEDSSNFKYSIIGGDQYKVFGIDSINGKIYVNSSDRLDYESIPIFELLIKIASKDYNQPTIGRIFIKVVNQVELPADGLVSHFSFSNGNAFNNGKLITSVIFSGLSFFENRHNKLYSALRFDSSDDYVKLNNQTFMNDTSGTFLVWVKFESLSGIQYLASVGDEDTNDNYLSLLRFDPQNKSISVYQREQGIANFICAKTAIEKDRYYCIALTSDGTCWAIYIDGLREDLFIKNGSNSGSWMGDVVNADNFVIGNVLIHPPYAIPNLCGVIDEVIIYNRVLNEYEIKQIYNDTK